MISYVQGVNDLNAISEQNLMRMRLYICMTKSTTKSILNQPTGNEFYEREA